MPISSVVFEGYCESLFQEQITGTMTFDELKRRCQVIAKAMKLRKAVFTISYRSNHSVSYTVKLEGHAGLLRKRKVSFTCERIYLNPTWSFEDLVWSREKIVTDVVCTMRISALPFYRKCRTIERHACEAKKERVGMLDFP